MHFTTAHRSAYFAIVPFLGALLPQTAAYAQVVTAVDGAGTYVEATENRIDISGGQISGDRANLFHSFEQFDLAAEQTANFVTTDNIQNVIGSIDGHQNSSSINGTLQISGSSANLYLLNPAGILLGPETQLNLSGGFTATTATSIGFAEGREFSTTGTENYSQFNGRPETLHFDRKQPGAVVNLADLSIETGETLSLIGGTVVNAGELRAPEGSITIAAVEGETLVRLSQEGQLLSFELDATERTRSTALSSMQISPMQIGEMLTGSAISSASELITHADGTVSLSQAKDVIDETGGSTIASGYLSAQGETGGTIDVLGSQVELRNATLDASGRVGGGLVRIGGDYQGEGALATATTTLIDSDSVVVANAIERGEGGRIIVWADDDTQFDGSIEATGGSFGGDGGFVEVSGKEHLRFTGRVDVGAPQGNNGSILLDPRHLVITDGPAPQNTSSTDYIASTAIEALTGDVSFSALDSITIQSLTDSELKFQNGTAVTFKADADGDGIGRFSMDPNNSLTARSGSFEIEGAGITLGSVNTDISGSSGGNITIRSSADVTANSISTNSYLGSGEDDNGGNVLITADGGDITIKNRIKTWSYSNNEGMGGDITLRSSGDISIESPQGGYNALESYSRALSGNADVGGIVTLSAPDGQVTINGINSSSIAINESARNGGDVRVDANSIQISNINSRTASTQREARAGEISLTAKESIEASGLRATGSRNGGIDNNIILTGDRIDLTGGNGSVKGAVLSLRPSTDARLITIGEATPTDLENPSGLPALNIWEQDLVTASGVRTIYIGSAEDTGTVQLSDRALLNPVSIEILGGQRLVGSSSDTLFKMTDLGAGSIGNSRVSFSNIEQFDGGEGGTNALSYQMVAAEPLVVDLENISNIQTVVGSSTVNGALVGRDSVNSWQISDSNEGLINDIEFSYFSDLIGGADTDRFEFVESGSISGLIDGRNGENRLASDAVNALLTVTGENQGRLSASDRAITTFQDISIFNGEQIVDPARIKANSSLIANVVSAQTTESAPDIATFSFGATSSETNIVSSILTEIEIGVSANFSDYLGLEDERRRQPPTLIEMQDTLHTVESETGVTPALVYAYFVPDAGTEDAVITGSNRPSRPDDQLEIMLITQDNELIRNRQWGVTRAQVEAMSQELRQQVTSQFSTAQQYLPPAQQLYNWLVRPIERTLVQREIDSIGFVMDTGLRTIPVAALHDGDRYLVESYSIGLLPTFSLTDFDQTLLGNRTDFGSANVLAMGASKFADQPALPAVEAEVSLITNDLWQGDAFLNEDFVLSNLQNQLEKESYQILHLATHATFESGDLDKSYIQLWDQQLSLSKMANLQLSDSEIGLIILSACNTAMGDEASEYGFAGFAVSAGSQSALASLWPVNDEGTLGFMSQFYNNIRMTSTRAEALRQAQVSLLNGELGITNGIVYGPNDEVIAEITELEESGRWNFSHPSYWSAFTMIGNPW